MQVYVPVHFFVSEIFPKNRFRIQIGWALSEKLRSVDFSLKTVGKQSKTVENGQSTVLGVRELLRWTAKLVKNGQN